VNPLSEEGRVKEKITLPTRKVIRQGKVGIAHPKGHLIIKMESASRRLILVRNQK
jgi:hypothetical protein